MLVIKFAHPWAWFLLFLPAIMSVYWYLLGRNSDSFSQFSHSSFSVKNSLKSKLRPYLPILPILASIFLIIAIARPQSELSKENSNTKGIDIILAIDVSTSMLESDFKPNRLEAAKKVAAEFISQRQSDRIGIVVFSGESYTQCPPTIDHNITQKLLKNIQNGIIEDGTAIGMGLATSVRSLKNSDAKSKVVILLTDGVNTAGTIAPNQAIEIAKAMNVKVYCIGVGTQKGNIMGIDEPLMQRIAKQTGGIYFRAGSDKRLKEIYDEINELEKVEIEVNSIQRKTEEFLPFAIVAIILGFMYIFFRYIFMKGVN